MGRKKNQTGPDNLSAAERRNDAVTLRRAGHPYRSIAQAMIAKYGDQLPKNYDERYASDDVHEELRRLKSLTQDTADELRQMELEKLEMVERALYDKVKGGNFGAIDRWIRVAESRRKLLGLDAPTKIAPTNPSGTENYKSYTLDDFGGIIATAREYEDALRAKNDTNRG